MREWSLVRQPVMIVPHRLGLSLPRTADPHPPSCSCFPPSPKFQYPGRFNFLFSNWCQLSEQCDYTYACFLLAKISERLPSLLKILAVFTIILTFSCSYMKGLFICQLSDFNASEIASLSKKVSDIPVPRQDVTNQTLPERE